MSAPDTRSVDPGAGWRLLRDREPVAFGDEYTEDDGKTWLKRDPLFEGELFYNRSHHPCRRRIQPPALQAAGDVAERAARRIYLYESEHHAGATPSISAIAAIIRAELPATPTVADPATVARPVIPPNITDRDLPPALRTGEIFWKNQWLQLHRELQSAHKGIRRLKGGQARWKAAVDSLQATLDAERAKVATPQAGSLSEAILALIDDLEPDEEPETPGHGYDLGYHDGCQEAAELAQAADAELARLRAEKTELEAVCRQLENVLRLHNNWQCSQNGEGAHGIDGAEAYADSDLCDQTIDAFGAARKALSQPATGEAQS